MAVGKLVPLPSYHSTLKVANKAWTLIQQVLDVGPGRGMFLLQASRYCDQFRILRYYRTMELQKQTIQCLIRSISIFSLMFSIDFVRHQLREFVCIHLSGACAQRFCIFRWPVRRLCSCWKGKAKTWYRLKLWGKICRLTVCIPDQMNSIIHELI